MKWQTSDAKRYYLNPNCFEKTKVRWGIFKKLSCTNVDLEHVRPLATNVGRIGEEAEIEIRQISQRTTAD